MSEKTNEINKADIKVKKNNSKRFNKQISKTTISKSKYTAKSSSKKNSCLPSMKNKSIISNQSKMADQKKYNTVKNMPIVEYYDLPYRYNKTIIKVLAQTPTTLFVYWDISDEDKKTLIKEYGDYFFYDTKPVLLIYNTTMNYNYEIDINDYSNSWYIRIPDANCNYEIKLGRRPINHYSNIDDYLEITSSNNISSPNDHILFENLANNVYFRNVKNNIINKKDISVSFLQKIEKVYNIQDFYKNLYKDEVIRFDKINFRNLPSS